MNAIDKLHILSIVTGTSYVIIINMFHFEFRWTFDNSSISSIKFNKWTGSKIPAADYTK